MDKRRWCFPSLRLCSLSLNFCTLFLVSTLTSGSSEEGGAVECEFSYKAVYTGNVSVSVSGYSCLFWNETGENDSEHNFCRQNGDDDDYPYVWCFAKDSPFGWDWCYVGTPNDPICNNQEFHRRTTMAIEANERKVLEEWQRLLPIDTSNSIASSWSQLTTLNDSNDAGFDPCSDKLESVLCDRGNVVFVGIWEIQFNSQLPQSLCSLSKLKYISMMRVGVYGRMPSLVNCTELVYLELSYNGLTGSIEFPATLREVWLVGTSLSGSVASLKDTVDLRQINIRGNNFSQSIPLLPKLSSLLYAGFEDNSFTGAFPFGPSNLLLKNIVMTRNAFSGSIPALPISIKTLSISHNKFSGQFISDISGYEDLEILTADHNLFTGNLPPYLPHASLQRLEIGHSKLTGSISNWNCPAPIVSLTGNQLTGCLDGFLLNDLNRNIKRADLSNNHFEYCATTTMDLPWLGYLDISSNGIVGPIHEIVLSPEGGLLILQGDKSSNPNAFECPLPSSQVGRYIVKLWCTQNNTGFIVGAVFVLLVGGVLLRKTCSEIRKTRDALSRSQTHETADIAITASAVQSPGTSPMCKVDPLLIELAERSAVLTSTAKSNARASGNKNSKDTNDSQQNKILNPRRRSIIVLADAARTAREKAAAKLEKIKVIFFFGLQAFFLFQFVLDITQGLELLEKVKEDATVCSIFSKPQALNRIESFDNVLRFILDSSWMSMEQKQTVNVAMASENIGGLIEALSLTPVAMDLPDYADRLLNNVKDLCADMPGCEWDSFTCQPSPSISHPKFSLLFSLCLVGLGATETIKFCCVIACLLVPRARGKLLFMCGTSVTSVLLLLNPRVFLQLVNLPDSAILNLIDLVFQALPFFCLFQYYVVVVNLTGLDLLSQLAICLNIMEIMDMILIIFSSVYLRFCFPAKQPVATATPVSATGQPPSNVDRITNSSKSKSDGKGTADNESAVREIPALVLLSPSDVTLVPLLVDKDDSDKEQEVDLVGSLDGVHRRAVSLNGVVRAIRSPILSPFPLPLPPEMSTLKINPTTSRVFSLAEQDDDLHTQDPLLDRLGGLNVLVHFATLLHDEERGRDTLALQSIDTY